MDKKPIGCVAKTGEDCPESGTYEVQAPSDPGTGSRRFDINDKLPKFDGKDVVWKLVKYND